jgi:hypothetical protein
MKDSWITKTLGIAAILLGAWSFYVHWVPNQTTYFNIVYVEVPQIGLMFAGWIGIHAADHRATKKHFHKHDLK